MNEFKRFTTASGNKHKLLEILKCHNLQVYAEGAHDVTCEKKLKMFFSIFFCFYQKIEHELWLMRFSIQQIFKVII